MNLRNKRICITGGNGFVGKNVCELLDGKKIDYINAPRGKYNLTVESDCNLLFDKTNPQILIHLAADAGGLGYNTTYPADIFVNNVLMNTNIIMSSAKHELEKSGYGTVQKATYPKRGCNGFSCRLRQPFACVCKRQTR